MDNQIHHGGYFDPPWWILEYTKFTCFILMICIFIFQQTQKQDGGYLNPQNKWNVGSDAFIIAQNINHNRERGYFLKPYYTFYPFTIQSENKERWRIPCFKGKIKKVLIQGWDYNFWKSGTILVKNLKKSKKNSGKFLRNWHIYVFNQNQEKINWKWKIIQKSLFFSFFLHVRWLIISKFNQKIKFGFEKINL